MHIGLHIDASIFPIKGKIETQSMDNLQTVIIIKTYLNHIPNES